MKQDVATVLAGYRSRVGDQAWSEFLGMLTFLEQDILSDLPVKPRGEAEFLRERVLALRRVRELMQGGKLEKQEHIYLT